MAEPRTAAGDRVAVLRSGPAGVRRWNRLTRAGRAAVRLARADLGGCDLSGVNLSGYVGKPPALAGAVRRDARLDGGRFAGAGFAGASLTDARLADASFDRQTRWPAGYVIPPELRFVGPNTDPRLAGTGAKAVPADVNGQMARLHAVIDPKRLANTLALLTGGTNCSSPRGTTPPRGARSAARPSRIRRSRACGRPTAPTPAAPRTSSCAMGCGASRANTCWCWWSGWPGPAGRTAGSSSPATTARTPCSSTRGCGPGRWTGGRPRPSPKTSTRCEAGGGRRHGRPPRRPERLHAALDDLVVRGVRAAGPTELTRLAGLRDEFRTTGADHLAHRLTVLHDAVRADDRAAAPALLRAMTAARLFDRLLTLEVATAALRAVGEDA